MFGRRPNHIGEFFIALRTLAHIARIDAVFGQCFGAVGEFGQQAFAVEMEIAHQRHGAAHVIQTAADFGHLGCGFGRVHGNPHHFRACIRQRFDLRGGGGGIGGVGVGHRLNDDRIFRTDGNMVDLDLVGFAAGDVGHGLYCDCRWITILSAGCFESRNQKAACTLVRYG